MALYKALEPISLHPSRPLYRDLRPGDIFEAAPGEVAGKDVLLLDAPEAEPGTPGVKPAHGKKAK